MKPPAAYDARPMKTALMHGLAAGALAMTLTAHSTPPASDADPWLWLEEVQGEQALAWVRERNAATRQQLEAWPELRRHARAHPGRAGLARPHPRRRAARRLRLQLLAGRRAPARPVAPHHAGRIPQGAARLGHRARPRRPGPRRRRELGLGRRGRAWARTTGAACCACRAAAPTRWWCASSTSPTRRFVAGGFDAARGEDRDRLDRPRHASTWAPISAPGSLTDSGYPRVIKRWARGQPLGQRRHGVRSASQRRRRQRQRGPHARLRAHGVQPRARLLHQRTGPARRRRAAAACPSRPTRS